MTTSGLPVAAVVVVTPLAHLDREFEYAVPEDLDAAAVPGVAVRVRFAGRDLTGFVVGRRAVASHVGALTPIRAVVSTEPVLSGGLLELCRVVAKHYGGTTSDVLRLAIPQRHARAERALTERPPSAPAALRHPAGDPGPWRRYPAGASWLHRVAAGEAPAASWLALPGAAPEEDWPQALAVAAAWSLRAGRGVVIVVPDHRDVDRVDSALLDVLGAGHHVRLTADQGPQARYTAWLTASRGHVRCVVGTRAAAFVPVRDLGLVAWWDDGDDLHEEPRAPYPAVGEVLRLRAQLSSAAVLCGGFARSARQQLAVADGVDRPVDAGRAGVRAAAARVVVAGEEAVRDGPAGAARLPSVAWRTAVSALQHGPVLVQVPRRGYVPALRCQDCRAPGRCRECSGPLALGASAAGVACRWCGTGLPPEGFVCPHCEGRRLLSSVVGARRTAEELGRAFPGVPVLTSGAGTVLPAAGPAPALVIATPGAEPVADGGYAAVLLLDGWALLERASLDAGLEALRRWMAAAALCRPAAVGGMVVLCGTSTTPGPAVEALVRWDPAWLAAAELAERSALRLPPMVTIARVTGDRQDLAELAASAAEIEAIERIGPVPLPAPAHGAVGDPAAAQLLLRVDRAGRGELARWLAAARAVRSAAKSAAPISVHVDVREPG